jgi:hypothetical protein
MGFAMAQSIVRGYAAGLPMEVQEISSAQEAAMFFRMFWTTFALLFAILAFCGVGPMQGGWLRIPFGLAFLFIAFVIWRAWRFISGDYSPAVMDGFARPYVDPGSRDEHYR